VKVKPANYYDKKRHASERFPELGAKAVTTTPETYRDYTQVRGGLVPSRTKLGTLLVSLFAVCL
jgi:hypothetical protein